MADDKMKETFTVTRHLSLSNSFGAIDKAKDVELKVTVFYNRSKERGWFEFIGGEDGDWYGSGNLVFTDGILTDYDGVYALPDFVLDWLQVQGVDVADMREAMSR